MMKTINPSQVQTDPLEITFASEVVYVPGRIFNNTGIYNLDGTPIPSAINHRGGQIHISSQIDETINIDSLPIIENDEPLLYTGPIYSHYGHFLVESTARLWPLLNSHKDFAGKFLCLGSPSAYLKKSFIQQIFGAFSLEYKNFIDYPAPCRIKNVFIPEPAFEINNRAHTLFRETMLHAGEFLVSDLKKINNSNSTPLYLSKSKLVSGGRGLINEIEIEEALRGMGVDILYPETMSLSEQIKELASRQFLIGTVGSAFHSLLLCHGGKTISVISFDRFVLKTFTMIDELCNNTAHYKSLADLDIELIDESEKIDDSSPRFRRNFQAQNPTKLAEQLLTSLQDD